MKSGQVHINTTPPRHIPQVLFTTNAWERMRGLIGKKPLTGDQGLWISPCPSVHTIGMSAAIDVVFISKQGHIKKVAHNLRPFRFAACAGAWAVLELAAGRAKQMQMIPGLQLTWTEQHD